MDYLKSLSNLYKGGIPNFPYTIGERLFSYDGQSLWSLHNGTKRDDGSPVSIFAFDIAAKRDKLPIALNALRKFKTIRHPDILRFLDGVETDTYIYIATEPVVPLQQQLDSKPDADFLTWGLYKLAIAVKFINKDVGSVHGNIRVSSIFTTKAGEWKLGGLDLLSNPKEDNAIIVTFGGLVPDAVKYASSEIKNDSWQALKSLDVSTTDSYNYATLIYEAYNGPFTNSEQLTQRGTIPNSLFNAYRRLLSPSPKSRPSVASFLQNGQKPNGYFQTELIQVNDFLENLNIKDQSERDNFLRKLNNTLDRLPSNFQKYKVLPVLINAFEYGVGGVNTLTPIIRIGKNLSEEEYNSMVVTSIVKMFASPDRAMRLSLLENLGEFIGHISNKVVNDSIYTHMVTGFTDTAPIIREQTIKAVLLIAPKLSDRNINNDLLRHLAKAQMDEQPGIRTNTTICLGKLAKMLNEGTRKKALVPAFTRTLRDTFVHARNAGLMALSATAEFYDAIDCATKIIPSVSLLLIDKEKLVRTQAFKTLEVYVKRVEKLAASMPDTVVENGAVSSPTPLTNAAGSIAGWAVESLTRSIAGGQLSIETSALSPLNGTKNHQSPSSPAFHTVPNSPIIHVPQSPSSQGVQNVPSFSKTFGATGPTKSIVPNGVENIMDSWDDHANEQEEDDWGSMDDPSPQVTVFPGFSSPKTNSISPIKSVSSGSSLKLSSVVKKSSRLGIIADQVVAEEDGWGDDGWGVENTIEETEIEVYDSIDSVSNISPSDHPILGSKPMNSLKKVDKQEEFARKREERRAKMNTSKANNKKTSSLGVRKT